jgi:hypothetical protein
LEIKIKEKLQHLKNLSSTWKLTITVIAAEIAAIQLPRMVLFKTLATLSLWLDSSIPAGITVWNFNKFNGFYPELRLN